METRDQFRAAAENLPNYLGQHILISVVALAIGISIILPVAVWASRSRTVRWPVVTLASIVQTIPSLALLALFYPVLLGVSYLTRTYLGFGFSALGFLPTVIALSLYSMLPVLRNTVTGIVGVDPSLTEAARGVGMSPRQILWKVELPLASPVIIAGIRTATVWVVGIATLSTPVGQTSLGNYIFTGLQTENWISVLFGCVAAAILALLLDQLIGLGESAAKKHSWPRGIAALSGVLLVIGAGLSPMALRVEADYVIGTKTFGEQFILGSLLAEELEEANFRVRKREGLGSTVVFRALAGNEIDCYVDYTGTIWSNYMKRTGAPSPRAVREGVEAWLQREHGIGTVGALGFENAYALAMRRDQAEELGIKTIADLAGHSFDLTIAGDYEFFGRPEWIRIRETYRLDFQEQKQFQSTFMYRAVADGDVDVISAFSTDGRIFAYDLVVLEDPQNVIPPYDAVLLVSPERADDQQFLEALDSLVGSIDMEMMREANYRVDRDENKETPRQAARWLRDRIQSANTNSASGN